MHLKDDADMGNAELRTGLKICFELLKTYYRLQFLFALDFWLWYLVWEIELQGNKFCRFEFLRKISGF